MSTVALGELLTIGLHRVIVPSVFHSHRSPLLCVRRERGGRVGGWIGEVERGKKKGDKRMLVRGKTSNDATA